MNTPISTSKMATTTYKPLQDVDEIRLLFLDPGEDCDPIKCSISHVKLPSKLQYEALSYMWGELGKPNADIVLNGQPYCVRENLFLALKNLRQTTTARALWIDALCINQQDINERNHQVNQMGTIYSQAQRVVAWLGRPSLHCLWAMRDISKGLVLPNLPWSQWDSEIKARIERARILCSHEYWGRLWIIQELVLATDILLQSGRDTLEWKSMCMFFMQIEKSARARSALTTADDIRASIPARIFRQWRDRQEAMSQNRKIDRNLHDLCLRYAEANCQDQRDKVFGLLGFAEDCCKEAVPVDYSLSLYEICGRVLQHHFLMHVYDEGEQSTTKELSGSHLDGRTPGLIILTSQIFHRRLGITTSQYTPPKNRTQLVVDAETPNILIERTPRPVLSIDQSIDRGKRRSWLKLLEAPRQFRDLMATLLIRADQAPKMVNATKVITSDTLLKVTGNVRGRVAWLSPPFTDELDFLSFELKPGLEASFEVENHFIGQELERIENNLIQSSQMTLYQELQLPIPAMPSDIDLVCSNPNAASAISCFTFPINFELPATKIKKSWFQEESSARSRPALESPPMHAQTHQGRASSTVAKRFYRIWTKVRDYMPKNGPKSHRIAIEEFGLICTVPFETQASDSICLFPQSDVIAIVRKVDAIGHVVGRAVSFLSHNSSTPLRNFDGWPELRQVSDNKVYFELDAEMLQMLTRASCKATSNI